MPPLEIIFYTFIAASVLLSIYHLFSLTIIGIKKPGESNHDMPVSVVVSAHFEFENLKLLVPALLEQKHSDYEVVIVDDKSEDESYVYLKEMSMQHDKINMVRIDDTPNHISDKKYALTLGIKAAKNDIILLTDADCLPASDQWISEMTASFANEKTKIVLGASVYRRGKGLVNLITRIETLYTALSYLFFALLGNPYMGVGRNMAFRKSYFMGKNGYGRFRNVVGGDDDLFVNEHAVSDNTEVVITPGATTFTSSKKLWKNYVIQKKRHMSVGKYYKLKDRVILGAIILFKIIFWLTFFTVIVAEYKLVETLSAFICVMVSLLTVLLILKRKIGEPTRLWLLPFLDITYLISYLSIGLKAKFTKKVRWS